MQGESQEKAGWLAWGVEGRWMKFFYNSIVQALVVVVVVVVVVVIVVALSFYLWLSSSVL